MDSQCDRCLRPTKDNRILNFRRFDEDSTNYVWLCPDCRVDLYQRNNEWLYEVARADSPRRKCRGYR